MEKVRLSLKPLIQYGDVIKHKHNILYKHLFYFCYCTISVSISKSEALSPLLPLFIIFNSSYICIYKKPILFSLQHISNWKSKDVIDNIHRYIRIFFLFICIECMHSLISMTLLFKVFVKGLKPYLKINYQINNKLGLK